MRILTLMLMAVSAPSAATQQGASATPPAPILALRDANDPYRPFAFLVGDWISQEGSSTLRQSIGWGPQRAYMTYSTYMQQPGQPERLHFDGIMAWSGKTRKLEFLFAVEPGSWIIERGTVEARADGSIVREVELIKPDGSLEQFRQTIRRTADNSAETSLMTRRGDRWEPNFPGSDRIEMRRRD